MVAELFLSAFLQVLFDRLAPTELPKFAVPEGFHSTLEEWKYTLKMIEALLDDAEKKQLTDGAVKLWLDDLKDLAYDVDDILDEFATDALSHKLVAEDQAGTSSVPSWLSAGFNQIITLSRSIMPNDRMESKIKDITCRMERLFELRTKLGLENIAGRSSSTGQQRGPPTTSLPTESAVYGRDEDKTKIIEMMSTAESSGANFLVIPIVGMGGLGKTTLARLVYNDEAMKDFKFDKKAWVCVSDDSDILRISKAILEDITRSPCDLTDLNPVQLQLKKAIAGERFLLVLDDVWNSDDDFWENLKSPFMAGAIGSKIIVTTRDENVASTAAPGGGYYKLKVLSDHGCWSVFKEHAFRGRVSGEVPNLELIRQKVVEKCQGLPLAARTLGGLLRSQRYDDSWIDTLNSKIWDLHDGNKILPVLRLSYHHLPAHLKRCFAYCSILPKGYEFAEKELVFLWMAEGLIKESKNHTQLEDLGCEYFRDLVARSIFLQSSAHDSKFIMHDLVNDLAEWASGEASFRMEDGLVANEQTKNFVRVRHYSYSSIRYDGRKKFVDFNEFKQLRTFLRVFLHDRFFYSHYIPNLVLPDLLLRLQKLRVLSLKRYYIEKIPDSIGKLKHLRYLDLSYTRIKTLPKSTSSLFNLQSLILEGCSCLMKLPDMRHLINVRHLNVRYVNKIKEMPLGIKKLKCLRTLSNFIVGENTGSCLKDLKDLKFLTGRLCISGLVNVTNSQDIREPILSDKEGIEVLSLEWGYDVDGSRDETGEERVLNMLRPHANIKEFTVKGYCGMNFPSWMGDSSFSNMIVLRLEGCVNCTSLPSLGELSSLKDLTIKGMTKIVSIGFGFYGESNSKAFQSLETLCFEDLPEWNHWEPLKESEQAGIYPCLLRKLSIVKCPKLTGILPENLPSLEELEIRECPQLLVNSSRHHPTHGYLQKDADKEAMGSNLVGCNSLASVTPEKNSEFGNWIKKGCQKVERLSIMGCEKLICLWVNEISLEKPPQGLHCFISLKRLCIEDCPTLVSFPELSVFPNLSSLVIRECYMLTSLPEGMKHGNTGLKSLWIEECDSLTFIVKGQLPPSLESLTVSNCEKLQILFDDTEDISLPSSSMMQNAFLSNTRTSALVCLDIADCPSLTALSSRGQLPVSLRSLYIDHCLKLASIAERFDNNMSLCCIYVLNCKNLSSLPRGLYNLNCLQRLEVTDCPNLVCFPEGGLPNTNLSIFFSGCEKLKELPEGFHNLSCLEDFFVDGCPSIKSFPVEGFPGNLRSLSVLGNPEIYKSLKEWGLHKLTCLTSLNICGCPGVVSFPEDEMGMMLPTSLIVLVVEEFPNLKYLSSRGFQDLTSLRTLVINNCPQLSSFPEGLTSSLLDLRINYCPLLKERCTRDKGREWSKIANVSYVIIDNKTIYDLEEEE
ncbi:putative disease resistance RPP13-like protein 1 isoform X2 [Mangifera indica]|uniref:putative disease resistance RPP13-like protein 1 isoform X2 n=1 Tax=Mangifera indica TaxID=29780 RepID=UPI001CFB35B5|nr:putative disease resistance RPP13-like protein 1 isoform X2 [Mangifera indica]